MLQLFIEETNLLLGVVNTSVAIIEGVHIPKDDPLRLKPLKDRAFHKAMSYTTEELRKHPILEGYRKIYRSLGYRPNEVTPAAQGMVELIQRRGQFPSINPAVDAYNTVVVDTLLGIGAHDLGRIAGPILFTRSTGKELFTPLGKTKPKLVPRGDLLYRDMHKVLARLAANDCNEAKLGFGTKDILLVIEGNPSTSLEDTQSAVRQACEYIVEFCGGTFVITEPTTFVQE